MSPLYLWALKRAGSVMIPLFLLNWIGVSYSLYGVLWWWDVMTHFLGGIFIGFLVLAIMTRFGADVDNMNTRWILISLSIFIGWELYEIIVGIIFPVARFDYVDTIHDVVNDTLGGLVAYQWFRQFYILNK